MPRRPLRDLQLEGSPNLLRALKNRVTSKRDLTKRTDLEALYLDLKSRRETALAEVTAHGLVIRTQATTARGELFTKTVPNPALKIAQQSEKQMVEISRLLASYSDCATEPKRETELDRLLGGQRDGN